MGGQNAWVTQGQASIDAMAMMEMRERSPHQQPLSGLNTAYLESLLGQEVVITLGDASTRQGTVNDVDREGTVALRKPRPPLIRGRESAGDAGPTNASSQDRDRVCIIPRDAVKGVEVVGGGELALDALRRVGGSERRKVSAVSSGVRSEWGGDRGAGLHTTTYTSTSRTMNAPFGFSPSFVPRVTTTTNGGRDPAAAQSSGAFL